MKKTKKRPSRQTASEEFSRGAHEIRVPKPNREQLENEVKILREQLGRRTPIEEQATIVAGLRMAVSNYRNRIADLQNDLEQERSNLSTAMLSHQQELTKFKEMTALQQEVQ